MRVLVTGASGMLGRAVARAVLDAGNEVRTMQRRPSGIVEAGVRFSEHLGSITNPADLAAAVDGVDAIVHLAAKVSLAGDPADFRAVNVEGTRMLIAAASAAHVTRLVYVSSPSVAHSGSSIVGEGALPANPAAARGEYARTKAEAELIALAADSPAMGVVAVRPHLVWGPGDTQLVGRIVERARSGRLPLLGGGTALIDTTYVDNAASAIAAALGRCDDIHGSSYVITNGEPWPVAELLAGICAAAGVRAPTRSVPAGLARGAGAAVEAVWRIRPGLSGHSTDEPPMTRFLAEQLSTAHWFDQRQTRADLDWMPTVSLDEGLGRLREHYQRTNL